jgi:hypothetical protein
MLTLPLTISADQRQQGRDAACRVRDDNHEHNVKTPLNLIGVIPVPGVPIQSADIAWVDPGTELLSR